MKKQEVRILLEIGFASKSTDLISYINMNCLRLMKINIFELTQRDLIGGMANMKAVLQMPNDLFKCICNI